MSKAQRLTVVPVVLAGGSGTRLWPLSRSLHPKQYLSLGVGKAKETLFQQAVRRVAGLANAAIDVHRPCVVANEEHRFTVVEQLRDIDIEPARCCGRTARGRSAPARRRCRAAARRR